MIEFDIFLSHSSLDIPAVREEAERWTKWKHTVFADFKDEILLKASEEKRVDASVAEYVRKKILECCIFVFAVTENSITSHWMPWELGLAHGAVGRVHLFLFDQTNWPVVPEPEFLSLYKNHCFYKSNARTYLDKVVNDAKSELLDPSQVERFLGMGKDFRIMLERSDVPGLSKKIQEFPAGGSATIRGSIMN